MIPADTISEKENRIQEIPISRLVPFQNHPFRIVDDEAMLRTTESIARYGILMPLIVRPTDGDNFEIISGHRRVHAAELAGLTNVPVIVRNLSDDEAVIMMVDSKPAEREDPTFREGFCVQDEGRSHEASGRTN